MNSGKMLLTRRDFCIQGSLAALLPGALAGKLIAETQTQTLEAKAIARGPKHHFFGYYEKCPWDTSGRFHLALEAPFMDRMPRSRDPVTVGMIDLAAENRFLPLDETLAWCWQMGTMLRWLPGAEDRLITYNQRQGQDFLSVIRDVRSGQVRKLPRPIYTLSPDGRYALTLNFARLARTRPGYGYDGERDPWADQKRPVQDGIFRMDMATGNAGLVLSLDHAAGLRPKESMKTAEHWFNHIQINTDGSRFAVLHRWLPEGSKRWETRTLTANPDGSTVFILADDGYWSHYDWQDRDHVLAHASVGVKRNYYLFTDRTDKAEPVAPGVLTTDGHCSFSPDRRWMLTDTYPDKERKRALLLYRMPGGPRTDIGRFFAPPEIDGPTRCDLHPRWSRDGKTVSLDSAHEGSRQVYVLDVGKIVAG
ncbi:MAG: hypothetical protein IMZ44_19170 [Planctomycetes bacterium]|nr:hypothetical protein [Planctomycetota bacterium]